MRADLEVSLRRPDPAIGPQAIVGAGPAAELEQLADDAHADCDRVASQLLGYTVVLAHHHARLARHAADATHPQIEATP